MSEQVADSYQAWMERMMGGAAKAKGWQRQAQELAYDTWETAGFEFVPEPILMKNTKGGELYYLFFASHQPVAKEIVDDIFNKYRGKA